MASTTKGMTIGSGSDERLEQKILVRTDDPDILERERIRVQSCCATSHHDGGGDAGGGLGERDIVGGDSCHKYLERGGRKTGFDGGLGNHHGQCLGELLGPDGGGDWKRSVSSEIQNQVQIFLLATPIAPPTERALMRRPETRPMYCGATPSCAVAMSNAMGLKNAKSVSTEPSTSIIDSR